MAERPVIAQALLDASVRARDEACAELGIGRLDIYWHGGPIHVGDGKPRRGGYDASTPDRIHLAAFLADPEEVVEVVRHECCHAAGFSEVQCGYFAAGVKPWIVDGKRYLPEGPVLRSTDWPPELQPEALRNAPPGQGLIAGDWGD